MKFVKVEVNKDPLKALKSGKERRNEAGALIQAAQKPTALSVLYSDFACLASLQCCCLSLLTPLPARLAALRAETSACRLALSASCTQVPEVAEGAPQVDQHERSARGSGRRGAIVSLLFPGRSAVVLMCLCTP